MSVQVDVNTLLAKIGALMVERDQFAAENQQLRQILDTLKKQESEPKAAQPSEKN